MGVTTCTFPRSTGDGWRKGGEDGQGVVVSTSYPVLGLRSEGRVGRVPRKFDRVGIVVKELNPTLGEVSPETLSQHSVLLLSGVRVRD